MAISLKHNFQSAKADGPDATLIQPSNWNAEHTLTQATDRLLGRTTAGTGPTEEISVGANLTFSGGTLALASSVSITALTASGAGSFGSLSVGGAGSFGSLSVGGSTALTTASSINSLADVNTSGATAGDGLSFNGATWVPGAAGGGMFKGENGTVGTRAGDIFRINEQTLNTNTTIDSDENASCTGPLTVASGVTLTVNGNLAVI